MTVTAAEQFAIELLNRMRIDPAETARIAKVDLNSGLPTVGYDRDNGIGYPTISTHQKQALAGIAALDRSATAHGDWMAKTGIFNHIGEGGTDHEDRIIAAGYAFNGAWTIGENLAIAGAATVDENLIALHLKTLFKSAPHRSNMFNPLYREAGIAETQNGKSSYLTQNFGYESAAIFVTGVAYNDINKNKFYSIGEGDGGVKFSAIGKGSVSTGEAGGYALELKTAETGLVKVGTLGTVEVMFSYAPEQAYNRDTQKYYDFRMNVKLDLVNGEELVTDSSLKLLNGVEIASLIGGLDRDLTGNARDNTLSGNSGKNKLSGLDGDDKLQGFGGNDKLTGGIGADTLKGGADNDQLSGQNDNDKLFGQAGNDRLDGGNGNDMLNGGAGNDTLLGLRDNDKLFGAAGNDLLDGGKGNDVLKGGAGADEFKFTKGFGVDLILDFNSGQGDQLLLDDRLWSGTMTAQQVVDTYAQPIGTKVAFTFDGGEKLTLRGVELSGLVDVIDIL